MRINSLYISAFGGIKDLKLDFGQGFNVIYGYNENGKSTVMAFIKMMFYGSDRGSAQLTKNIRKKYTPWDGDKMAGYIDFEHKGKKYRLEREFKSSNSTDRVFLLDLDLGEKRVASPDVGNQFFGLTAAAFERSVFIGQLGYPEPDSAAEGEINSKLSNIALTGEEEVSFEAVYGRIEKEKLRLMSKSGRAGEYDKNLKAAALLKADYERAMEEQRLIAERREQIGSFASEIASLQQNQAELKSQLAAEQDIRNAEKLKALLSLKDELDSLNDKLKLSDGSLADEMYLNKLRFCISKAQKAREILEAKKGEAATLRKSLEAGLNPPENANEETAEGIRTEIQRAEAELEANSTESLEKELLSLRQTKVNTKKAKCLLAIGAMLTVLGGAGAFLILPALAVGAIGLILLLCGLLTVSANNKSKAEGQAKVEQLNKRITEKRFKKEVLEKEIFQKKLQLEAILTALNTTAAVIERQREMLKTTEAEAEELGEVLSVENNILLELYLKYNPNGSLELLGEDLESISKSCSLQKELKQRIGFILKDLNGISYEEARAKLEKIENEHKALSADFELIKARYEEICAELNNKSIQLAGLKAQLKALTENSKNPEELKAKLKTLGTSLLHQKEFCDAADIALRVLTESFGEVRRSFGSVLESKAACIMEKLTDGKYADMSISRSFQINVTEKNAFGSRELAYLSSGTADQIYLALRLALAQLIGNEEKLPLLLDDSLTQYDDKRAQKALEFLKEYSEDYQVIMFTCHKNIVFLAEKSGANSKILQ